MRYLLLLILGPLLPSLPVSLVAIESTDLPGIFDVPGQTLTLDVTNADLAEDTETTHTGTSSLAVRPRFDESAQTHKLDFSIKIPQAGPGRFSCWARVSQGNLTLFDVNYQWASEFLPQDYQEDTWYKVTFPILPDQNEIVFSMRPHTVSGDAIYHFDAFQFEAGVSLSAEDIPEAGPLIFSPQKELYQVGETVSVSLTPNPGYNVPFINVIDLQYAVETLRPLAFQITAEKDLLFRPHYVQRVTLDGYRADVTLYDSIVDLQSSPFFTAREIVIHEVPKATLLKFEADMLQYREIAVTGEQSTYPLSPLIHHFNDYLGIQAFRSFITEDEKTLTIDVSSHRIPTNLHYLPFQNLSLSTEQTLDIEVSGKGSVSPIYAPGPTPNTTKATLTASPEPGWEFWKWTGLFQSTQSQEQLVIDAPGSVQAHFAKRFTFGTSQWAFTPDDQTEISLINNQSELRIDSSDPDSSLPLTIALYGLGKFSANVCHYNDDDSLQSSTPLILDNLLVESTPHYLTPDLSIPDSGYIVIKGIITSGGTGYSDVGLEVLAPTGSISKTPDTLNHEFGSSVTLRVADAWKDQFVGWVGDFHSANHELSLTLDRPLQIAAVFASETETIADRAVKSQGSKLMKFTPSSSEIKTLDTTLAPGQWTELELDVRTPLSIQIAFTGDFKTAPRAFFTGEDEVDDEHLQPSPQGESIFCTLPPQAEGPFRIRITNASDDAITGALSIEGFYQDTSDWIPFRSKYDVTLSPDDRYLPIDSKVTVSAVTRQNNTHFGSWVDRPETDPEFELTVREGEEVFLKPRFNFTPAFPGVSPLYIESSHWVLWSEREYLNTSDYAEQEPQTASIEVEGPGVFAFDISHTSSSPGLSISVLEEGEEARYGDFGFTLDSDIEVLVGEGTRVIDIVTSVSQENIAAGQQPGTGQIRILGFTPGFGVAGLKELPYRAVDSSTTSPSVFEKGTQVTLSPLNMPQGEFGGWRGDLAGQPETVTAKLDRHIIANAFETTDRKYGPVEIAISESAVFSSIGAEHGAHYYIENESGPTAMTFRVDPLTELSFSLRNAEIPTEVWVDGQLVYQDQQGFPSFAFPVKEHTQTIVLKFDLDPSAERQVAVESISWRQQFELAGDFGQRQENVTADPIKDFYAPGESVTVELTEAADDWVFYDLALVLPNLAIFEWLEKENGTKSFELEIASDTYLIGQVGPLPSRAHGDIITSSNLALASSSVDSPDGGPVQKGTIRNEDTSFARFYYPNKKHLFFWLKMPEGHSWVFPQIQIDGEVFQISGDGDWQQISIPTDPESDYLSAFITRPGPVGGDFYLTEIRSIDNYSIPFVSSGAGKIELSPETGVSALSDPLTLKATPDDGHFLQYWGIEKKSAETRLTLAPNNAPRLTPLFAPKAQLLELHGLTLEVISDTPPTFNSETTQLSFEQDDTAVRFSVEGPGRVTYRAEHSSSNGKLVVYLDGERLHEHQRYPTAGNPSEPQIRIPQGSHTLEMRHLENSDDDDEIRSELHDLSFESGAFLNLPQYITNGSVSISPDRTFFEIGESVTLTANPAYDRALGNWGGDLIGSLSPYTFTISDHLSIDPYFKYEQTVEHENLTWHISESPQNQNVSAATVDVEGPGYFTLGPDITVYPTFRTFLNGLQTPTAQTAKGTVITIPPGKHRLQIQSSYLDVGSPYSAPYTRGYLFTVSSQDYLFDVSPAQAAYLEGTEVSLSLNPSAPVSIVDGSPLAHGQTITITIDDHKIIPVAPAIAIGPNVSTEDRGRRITLTTDNDHTNITIKQDRSGNYPRLYQTITGPSTLEFTVSKLEYTILSLEINGHRIAQIDESGNFQFNIPTDTHTITWSARPYGSDSSDIVIKRLHPKERTLSDFEHLFEPSLPSHAIARGLRLGPEEDLDLDGRTNLEELESGTPSHLFDFDVKVSITTSEYPFLEFQLPNGFDTTKVHLLSLASENGLTHWARQSLEDLIYFRIPNLDYERFVIDLDAIEYGSSLSRLAVDSRTE